MKRMIHIHRLQATILSIVLFFYAGVATTTSAQCLAGSNTANLNWDNMDYLVTTGSYAGFVTAAMSQTQAFAIGVNRVVVNFPGTVSTFLVGSSKS